MGRASQRRRGAPARLTPGHRIAAAVFPGRDASHIHVQSCYLLAVDGGRVEAGFDLDSALSFKFDHRVVLTGASDLSGRDKRDVALRAINGISEKGLLYRQWVADRRAYVAKI